MGSVVIIGGGIIGTSLAYQLRNTSLEVMVLEKNTLGSGTTAKSIALFYWQQIDFEQNYHNLIQESWKTYQPLIENDEITFERIGSLNVAETDEKLKHLKTLTEKHRQVGLESRILTPEQLAEYNIEDDDVKGAMYTPEDGYLDPYEIVQYFAQEASENNVKVRTGVEVTDVKMDGGRVTGVETTEGNIDAEVVVNAAGPWASRINEMAGVSIPLRHTLGPILVLQVDYEVVLPFVMFEDGTYFREEGTNQAFAGKFETSYENAIELEPDIPPSVDEEFRNHIAERIFDSIPQLKSAEVVNDWVGIRTVTPDEKPVVGEINKDGFMVACGMSGEGITLAPAVTQLLADYITEDRENGLLNYLSPNRFD